MGRDKRNEARAEHWTKMVRPLMDTDAWRALSPTAQALYPWIRLEWRGDKTNNNGKLRLSVRQAAEAMGCNKDTAALAFRELQAKGFVVQTEGGSLGTGGQGKSPAYELTEIALPHERSGRRLYRDWSEGHDYPVKTGPAPTRPKTKSRPNSSDSVVRIFRTKGK